MTTATEPETHQAVIALDILTTRGMQLREGTNGKIVSQYTERYKNGDTMDPIVVCIDRTAELTYLIDGHHRVAAAKRAGLDKLPVVIIEGDRRTAIWAAANANVKHGLQLTNEDKRNIADLLLRDDEWRSYSDRKLADHIHTSPNFVAKRRKKLPKELQSDTRKGKDGKVINTKNIGKIKDVVIEPAPTPVPVEETITEHDPIVVIDDKEPEELKIDDAPQTPAPAAALGGRFCLTCKRKLPDDLHGVSICNSCKSAPVPSSLANDQDRAIALAKKTRQALSGMLAGGKHQWTGTDRQLVSLALVTGIPVTADDEKWTDTLPARAFTELADRLKLEVADRLKGPDAYRLPPAEIIAAWWAIDLKAAIITAERFL